VNPVALGKTLSYTALALVAFAANSVLCRLALEQHHTDALSFTVIRLVSGAVTLGLLLRLGGGSLRRPSRRGWLAAALLFFYALSFSFAYLSLDTATGALILFGSVQITMLVKSIWEGELLNGQEWLGASLALFGFVYLVLPDLHTPSVSGFTLMTISGIAWGIYTAMGRNSREPFAETTCNFIAAIPLVVVITGLGFVFGGLSINQTGFLIALASGALASGVGYAIWYKVLPFLSSTQAAVSQLMVPILAASGGVLFLSESLSSRLVQSAVLLLGGLALIFIARRPAASP